jgi:type II secretory pathway component PulJ
MRLIGWIRGRLRGDDRGVTLAELAVTTGIMSMVMAIFTTGVVQLFKAGDKNELVAATQAQLNNAFLRLDRELRYAAGFGPVHTDVAGNVFVEYVNTGTPDGTPQCAQMELYAAGKTLRRQVWPQQTGVKPQNKWATLASQVNVAKSSFALVRSNRSTFQRLHVVLVVLTNPGNGQTEATTDLTFTALNSKSDTDPTTICPEGRL